MDLNILKEGTTLIIETFQNSGRNLNEKLKDALGFEI
jgi:hypothetical protein